MSVFTHKSFSVNLSSPSKLLHPTRPLRATRGSRSVAPRASTAPDSDVVPGDIIKCECFASVPSCRAREILMSDATRG